MDCKCKARRLAARGCQGLYRGLSYGAVAAQVGFGHGPRCGCAWLCMPSPCTELTDSPGKSEGCSRSVSLS